MKNFILRPVDTGRDFGQIAALFTLEQDEPTTEPGLMVDYEVHKDRIICLTAVEDGKGELAGFNWCTRGRFDVDHAYCFLIVKQGLRRQGVGGRLYEDLFQTVKNNHIKKLQIDIRDTCKDGRMFAERRGFAEREHSIAMELDTFNERAYDEIISKLENAGFKFTSMQAMGNTGEAQRKLYELNDSTALDMPASDGGHCWLSFDDFQ